MATENTLNALEEMLNNISEKIIETEIVLEQEKNKYKEQKANIQMMKEAVFSNYNRMYEFLRREEEQHLSRLDKKEQKNLAKFKENEWKLSEQVQDLQMMAIKLDIDKVKKLDFNMIQDAKDILNKSEALLLQYPKPNLPKWTMCHITGLREMMMTFQRDIKLDPETANPHLIVSSELKSVKHSLVPQDVPDNPERFDFSATVLSIQSFTSGIHYWEVETGDMIEWEVGICKSSINRKGSPPLIPGEIIGLKAFKEREKFCLSVTHIEDNFHIKKPIQRIGVFLDYESGHIAFYNVTDGLLIYSMSAIAFKGPFRSFFSPCFQNKGCPSRSLVICPMDNQPFLGNSFT
ncbi:probable E3 ubiquitin-protein ligase TRIML1 [Gracilinanus agilis]|uniref:probable E3 ubiquitin-protein ligase TRIML1 n=1 Tax=Gracilinanus agilis TaxID=191870 RepID=UPI001CFD51E1|nr:probable E3 ubiquitin-protein ligase TRIML1 [Gracilinanus agilis]